MVTVSEEKKEEKTYKPVDIPAVVTLKEFAELLKVAPADIQRKLMSLGVLAALNQKLSPEVVTRLAKSFGFAATIVTPSAPAPVAAPIAKPAPTPMKPRVKGGGEIVARPPVVTIMGHVDHGKTTLLDAIRNAKVVDSEFGGITQHIGAYQVEINDPANPGEKRKITFLDTPGHAAFTSMRARGAQVTDVVVIVVAADDGVMPQTEEAINHAKAAGVPIIIAINKMDKADANPDRVLTQLASDYEVMPEKYGGNVQTVEVSALKKEGLDNLLETILLVSDLEVEPKADPTAPAQAIVIEAQLDKGRGAVATVLVDQGTLRLGDIIVAGSSHGKIRAMNNDRGQRVDRATPSTPVEILGLNDVPTAGDRLVVVKNEKEARQRADETARAVRTDKLSLTSSRVSLEELFKQFNDGVMKELNLILKGDVQGSVEAIRQSLAKIEHAEVKVSFKLTGVGPIGESDVDLAAASGAIIVGFNVKADSAAVKLAERLKVQIREYKIIYDLIDDVRKAMAGLLDPIFEEAPLGSAIVRATFKLPKQGGIIAGSYITDGKVNRGALVRVRRAGKLIAEGKIDTLRREKDDVREVATGFECGIYINGYTPLEDDVIEAYEMRKVERTI
jgi:translation initiation factor IF-2